MTRNALLLLTFCFWVLSFSSANGQAWRKTLGKAGAPSLVDVAATNDGHYYIGGSRLVQEKEGKAWAYKVDEEGNEIWYKEFPINGRAKRIGAFPDNSILIAGSTFTANYQPSQMMALRASPEGEVIWEKTFPNDSEQLIDLAPIPDGSGYVLLGQGRDYLEEKFFVRLLAIDENGKELWEQRIFPEGGRVFAGDVLPLSGGRFVIGGQQSGIGGYLCEVNREEGLLWESVTPSEHKAFLFNLLASTSDGRILAFAKGARSLAGYEFGADGRLLRDLNLGSAFVEKASRILPVSDQGFVLLGHQFNLGSYGQNLYLARLNAELEIEWSQTFPSSYSEEAAGIFPAPGGGLLLFGTQAYNAKPEGPKVIILKTNSLEMAAPSEAPSPAEAPEWDSPFFHPPRLLMRSLGYPVRTDALDVDQDGHTDLLCLSEEGRRLEWFPGPEWNKPHLICEDCQDILQLAVADLNGDGRKDITAARAGYPSLVAWFNEGGAFGEARTLIPNLKGIKLILPADIGQDGGQDLLIGSLSHDAFTWLENLDGKGNFSEPQVLNTPIRGPEKIEIMAFDPDGFPQLLVLAGDCCKESALHWLKMKSDELVELQTIPLQHTNAAFTGGDFDRDGNYEFLLSQGMTNHLHHHEIEPGKRQFAFQDSIFYGENPRIFTPLYRLHTLDINRDGWPDVFAERGHPFWIKNEEGVLRDIRPSGIRMTRAEQSFSSADLNLDGYIDLLLTAPRHHLANSYTFDAARDTFIRRPYILPSLGFDRNEQPADFNGDGHPDLIVENRATNELGWMANPAMEERPSGFHPIFKNLGYRNTSELLIAPAKRNAPMMALLRYDTAFHIALKQDTKGEEWTVETLGKPFSLARQMQLLDIDRDWQPDLFFDTGKGLYWSRGESGPAFGEPQALPSTQWGDDFLLADYNGDGFSDCIVGKYRENKMAIYLFSPQNGQFLEPFYIPTEKKNLVPEAILARYQDGRVGILARENNGHDLMLVNSDGQTEYLYQDDKENFYRLLPVHFGPDGRRRIFYSGDTLGWLEKQNGQWQKYILYEPSGRYPAVQSLALTDMDGDGKEDLLVALSENKLLLFKQK